MLLLYMGNDFSIFEGCLILAYLADRVIDIFGAAYLQLVFAYYFRLIFEYIIVSVESGCENKKFQSFLSRSD